MLNKNLRISTNLVDSAIKAMAKETNGEIEERSIIIRKQLVLLQKKCNLKQIVSRLIRFFFYLV